MRTAMLPAVRVTEELRADAEKVLVEGETLSSFIESTLRQAVEHRQVQAEFEARAETAWQNFQRTGVSFPAEEVFDRLRARIDARRKALSSDR